MSNYNRESGYGKDVFNSFKPLPGGNVFVVCADSTYPNYDMLQDLFRPDPMGVQRLHATITTAVAAAKAYDTIYIIGTNTSALTQVDDYDEDVTIPATKMGLRLIGCGNSYEGVLWGSSAADSKIILSVKAQNVYIENLRLRPEGASGWAMDLYKDATQVSHGFKAKNCQFRSQTTTASGVNMKPNSGGTANDVTFEDCIFDSLLVAINNGSGSATIGSRFKMIRCMINGTCTAGVVHSTRRSLFLDTSFADLGGGQCVRSGGGDNFYNGCQFGSDEVPTSSSTEVAGGADDVFAGSSTQAPDTANYCKNGRFFDKVPGVG